MQENTEATIVRKPRTRTEKILARIWSDILDIGIDRIDVHANFFHLGGDSFLVPQVIERIDEKMSLELSVGALFEYPELASLSRFIEESREF